MPGQVKVAIDTLAVYVHKENPVERVSLPQVDAIFSKGRKGGHAGSIDTWGELGREDACADHRSGSTGATRPRARLENGNVYGWPAGLASSSACASPAPSPCSPR